MTEWERKGALIALNADLLDDEIEIVKQLMPKSNDTHVIALARLSGGAVLITRDKALMKDFKNKNLLAGNRAIYPERVNVDLRPHRKILKTAVC